MKKSNRALKTQKAAGFPTADEKLSFHTELLLLIRPQHRQRLPQVSTSTPFGKRPFNAA